MLATLYRTGDLGRRLAAAHGEPCETPEQKRRWAQKARRTLIRAARSMGRNPAEYQLGGRYGRYVMGLPDLLAACGPLGRELMARTSEAAK